MQSIGLPLLKSVVSLSLDGCRLPKSATTSIARNVGGLSTLRTLSLSRNDFEAMDVLLGASLSSLRGITHLYLHRCRISASTLVPLVLLEQLVALDVSCNSLGDAGARNLAALYASAPGLRDVSLNDCQVCSSLPKSYFPQSHHCPPLRKQFCSSCTFSYAMVTL